jgi:hypothetical protein
MDIFNFKITEVALDKIVIKKIFKKLYLDLHFLISFYYITLLDV